MSYEDKDATNGSTANIDKANDLTNESNAVDFYESSDIRHLSMLIRDGLDMPIADLEVFVTMPLGLVCKAETTEQGAITVPISKEDRGQAKVEVKDAAGNLQQVCKLDLAQCRNAVIIRSPKVKAKVKSQQHHQKLSPINDAKSAANKPKAGNTSATNNTSAVPAPVDTNSAWWDANGALDKAWTWLSESLHISQQPPKSTPQTPIVAQALNKGGNPVTVVMGPECPNKDNLRLGRNNVYRQAVLDAAKRLGLKPQSLCALIDCEAGKIVERVPKLDADGKPLKDKSGKQQFTTYHELWNANAGNAQSGAAGLTQFLGSTWLTHVLCPRFYIHEQSVAIGWVRKESDGKGRMHWVFVLADGKTTAKVSKHQWSDDNVKKCLAMRMDPTWSINAAADYGNANLKVLKDKGFKLDGLNDMDKAKLMYLMHHEGEGAGPLFIQNKLASISGGVERLRRTFVMQLGGNGEVLAEKRINKADGDVEVAYRWWLAEFVDRNFVQSGRYFCSTPIAVTKLSDLLKMIGGVEIQSVD